MASDRDVAAFDERAAGYESGWLGRMHHDIADRAVDLAVSCTGEPQRILDVGCGTGYLLRRLADTFPRAETLVGIDPASGMMIRATEAAATYPRLSFVSGVAEHLPFAAASFDLLITTTAFDHWLDQRDGLVECLRVLRPVGHLVLCDQFSPWLAPTLVGSRRGKARTKRRATALLLSAGFAEPCWHTMHTPLIRTVTANAPPL